MQFLFEQVVERSVDEVFAFHRDPHNLQIILHDWPALRFLHSDGGIEVGCRNWFEVNVFGIVPMVLGFEHIVYEPPHRFGERLIHGPFREFTHIHEFEKHEQGTLIRDVVEVSLPPHYGGEWGMRLLVVPKVRRVFVLRAAGYRRLPLNPFDAPSVHRDLERCLGPLPPRGGGLGWGGDVPEGSPPPQPSPIQGEGAGISSP